MIALLSDVEAEFHLLSGAVMRLFVLLVSILFSHTAVSKNIETIPNFSTKNKSTKLYTYKAKNNEAHRFYIQSGLHGNEHSPIRFSRWLMKRLDSGVGPLSKLNGTATLDILPIANPDGYHTVDRLNAKGANLNRNFNILFGKTKEYPGEKSFSEKETQGIQKILTANRYTGAVDLHGYINWIVGPSNPYMLGNTEKYSTQRLEQYRSWDKALKRTTRSLKGYEYRTAGGLGDGGAFEDWAFWELGIPAFCLEIEESVKTTTVASRQSYFEKYELALYNTFLEAIKVDSAGRSTNIASNP